MPLKPHPTDPDKMVYVSRQYDIPQLQGVTTQRPWVGLTVDEILLALKSVDPETKRLPKGLADFANAIEAELRSKNEH